MASSIVGGGNKFRDYLSDEELKNTKWRNGPPSYDVVDKLFEQERTNVWAEGSVEEKVQRLLKTWEMEIVHKADPNELKTMDPNKFTISINGRKGLTPAESAKLGGSYNIFLQTSLPENVRLYNPDDETFESSQNLFRSIFLRGFAIEILHVYSGPPGIVYRFRHWGYMDGPFKGHAPTGQLIELFGIGTFELDKESNKIIKAEMFFDRGELLGGLVKGESNVASTSGRFVENSLIRFRGDSGMNDGKSNEKNLDLVSGFYDAGNNIKFSFTIAYTVRLLSWTVIEYHEKYEDLGEIDHVKDIIKWGSLYLLKLFVPPNNSSTTTSARIYSQVGRNNSNAENDLTCWQRPEYMNYPRLVSVCDISTASDLAGEMVAAMSAASLVLKEDKDISEELVKTAEELFILANRTAKKGKYTTNDECGGQARQFNNSTSYKDELDWAVKEQVASDEDVFDWNNKITAISILLTRIRYFRDLGYPYESSFISSTNNIDLLMCSYTSDTKYSKTAGDVSMFIFFAIHSIKTLKIDAFSVGLILLKPSTDAALLQYAATSSFLSKLYSDYLQLLRTPSRRFLILSFPWKV
ncbi:hypothetical protein MTR67_020036 [Solanum verrucosum]|uniref:cellulase n=1 Tax=Solanum verrucosum TaxID=315347 RepID=A0AAF0QU18_SOLVR|nr:hypothetical protein MTR67_020036 [Solanum verrucosum]